MYQVHGRKHVPQLIGCDTIQLMDNRIVVAFWAVDILLVAGPFVIPGVVPLEIAWLAIAMAVLMIVYSAFPRRLIPSRWRAMKKNEVDNMAKLTFVHTSGRIGKIAVTGNHVEGFPDVDFLRNEGDIGEANISNNTSIQNADDKKKKENRI